METETKLKRIACLVAGVSIVMIMVVIILYKETIPELKVARIEMCSEINKIFTQEEIKSLASTDYLKGNATTLRFNMLMYMSGKVNHTHYKCCYCCLPTAHNDYIFCTIFNTRVFDMGVVQ